MTGRPHDSLRAAEAVRALKRASVALLCASRTTDDKTVQDSIQPADKELRIATSRAKACLQHADLMTAEQSNLFQKDGPK